LSISLSLARPFFILASVAGFIKDRILAVSASKNCLYLNIERAWPTALSRVLAVPLIILSSCSNINLFVVSIAFFGAYANISAALLSIPGTLAAPTFATPLKVVPTTFGITAVATPPSKPTFILLNNLRAASSLPSKPTLLSVLI